MSMQQIMRWEHDFLRIGGKDIETFGPMGKIQMSKGEPIKLSTTHFVFCAQSFNYARIGWVSYCMRMGKVWESEIWIWGSTYFWENVFWLMGQVIAQKCCPFPHAFTSSSSFTFLGALGHSHSRFWSCCTFPIHVFGVVVHSPFMFL